MSTFSRRSLLRFLGAASVAAPAAAVAAVRGDAVPVKVAAGELVGAPKPTLLGRVLAAPAYEEVLSIWVESPTTGIYIVADALESVDAVRDGGVPLTIDGDAPDRDALVAADVLPGHARTCLREGLVKTGTPPFGALTVDARGADLVGANVYYDGVFGAAREDLAWLAELSRRGQLK